MCTQYMFQIHLDVLTIEEHVHINVHIRVYSTDCNQMRLLSSMYISRIIWSDVGVYAHQYIPFPHKSCQSQWFRKIRISFYASNTFTREKDRLLSKTISFFTRSGIKQIAATNEMQWSSCLHGHGYESFLLMAFDSHTFQDGNSMFEEWMKFIEVCNIFK